MIWGEKKLESEQKESTEDSFTNRFTEEEALPVPGGPTTKRGEHGEQESPRCMHAVNYPREKRRVSAVVK